MPDRCDGVLLDLYDTIVWSDWTRVRKSMESEMGVDGRVFLDALEKTRPARGVGTYRDAEGDMEAVLEAAEIGHDAALVRALTDMERELLTHAVHLYDDVLPTVRELRAGGARTALISNCSHSTRPVVDRLRLEHEFDTVVLSFEVGVMKPDPAIYEIALERLGAVDPARAIFVDDQTEYCDGAAAVGLSTRLILRHDDRSFESVVATPGPPPVETHGHEVIHDLQSLRD